MQIKGRNYIPLSKHKGENKINGCNMKGASNKRAFQVKYFLQKNQKIVVTGIMAQN